MMSVVNVKVVSFRRRRQALDESQLFYMLDRDSISLFSGFV